MTQAKFTQVQISGLSAVVAAQEISLIDELSYYDGNREKIDKIYRTVGLAKRRVATTNETAADYCVQAAKKLLIEMAVATNDIDAVIFISQTPDYRMPPTACDIHRRLGLSSGCFAFDINQGCAGWTYGLYIASSFIENGGCRSVLLLVGDTLSKYCNVENRITASVIGDSGTATLLTRTSVETSSYYDLGADGSGSEVMIIPAGGARLPFTRDNADNVRLIKKLTKKNNHTYLTDFYMNGIEVFNFTMGIIPDKIIQLMKFANITQKNVDYLLLHQANRQIVQQIAHNINFPVEKTPCASISKYGNLSGSSIVVAICDELQKKVVNDKLKLLCCGYGIGLSWATAYLSLNKIYCSGVHDFVAAEKLPLRSDLINKWESLLSD